MSHLAQYDVGDVIEISARIVRRLTGALLDPATLVVWVQPPSGVVYSLTYGVDPEVLRDGAGLYRVLVDALIDGVGEWIFVVKTTGANMKAMQPQFITVRPPPFTIP